MLSCSSRVIGASDDVEAELGIHLDARSERLDLLGDLRLDPARAPAGPGRRRHLALTRSVQRFVLLEMLVEEPQHR